MGDIDDVKAFLDDAAELAEGVVKSTLLMVRKEVEWIETEGYIPNAE